jgi:hypothetical protein
MEEATRWYTWKGNCVERIRATDVKSHAAADKLGPFVDLQVKPVLWVGWAVARTARRYRLTSGIGREMWQARIGARV